MVCFILASGNHEYGHLTIRKLERNNIKFEASQGIFFAITLKDLMKLFKNIHKLLLDSDYLKDLSKLVSGSMIANLLPILISPVLSRMYSPETFGTFGLYISIVNIATVVFTGRYEYAIVLSKTRKEVMELFYLAMLIGLVWLIIG